MSIPEGRLLSDLGDFLEALQALPIGLDRDVSMDGEVAVLLVSAIHGKVLFPDFVGGAIRIGLAILPERSPYDVFFVASRTDNYRARFARVSLVGQRRSDQIF